jgi:hypothetical protein
VKSLSVFKNKKEMRKGQALKTGKEDPMNRE